MTSNDSTTFFYKPLKILGLANSSVVSSSPVSSFPGSHAPGRDRSSGGRGGLASLSRVSGGGDCAIRSNKTRPPPPARPAFLRTLPVGATQPETRGLRGGIRAGAVRDPPAEGPAPPTAAPRPSCSGRRKVSCWAGTRGAAWRASPVGARPRAVLAAAVPGATGFGTQSRGGPRRHRLPGAEKAWGVARSEPEKTRADAALPEG